MKWLDLETEIRGYITISGIVFLVTVLSGCGNTITGFGKDISDVGTKVIGWQNEKPSVKKETK